MTAPILILTDTQAMALHLGLILIGVLLLIYAAAMSGQRGRK